MKKTIIILVLAALCLHLSTKAQDPNNKLPEKNSLLTGTIKDLQGQPIPGATITENSNKTSTQAGPDGKFNLRADKSTGTITVSYLGYLTKNLSYNIAEPLNVILEVSTNELQAVEINTGYYKIEKRNLTGSISSVNSETIERQPISNPLLAISGQVPGAYVQQVSGTPGSAVNLLIRGQNSIDAGSSPLYLVDGIPFNSSSLSNSGSAATAAFGSGGTSPFATLSPDDISSIEILKDADATAIYGSRGANGVVLITTKKGRPGTVRVDINSYYGYNQLAKMVEMMDTEAFLTLRNRALALDGIAAPRATDFDLNGTWDQRKSTDWQKELLGGNASLSNTTMSVSGGSENAKFYLSGSHQRQGTITSGDQRYSRSGAHLSGTVSSADQKFTATASVSYSADNSNWINSDLVARALTLQPNAPELYLQDGGLNWASSSWTNPLRIFENRYRAKNSSLTASAQLSFSPIANLELSARVGHTQSSIDDRSLTPASYYDPAQGITSANSVADFNQALHKIYSVEPQASYKINGKLGSLSLLAGVSLQSSHRTQLLTRGTGFSSDALIENLQSATVVGVRGSLQADYRYIGTYARIGYIVDGRYILNLTGRRDGSSRFGSGRKFAGFGAVGAGYIISETSLFKEKLPIFSLLKLRASYGSAGNDQIGDYEYLDAYQSVTGYNGLPGLSPIRLFNPDFGWETTRKLEIGLDFGLMKDQIRGSVGYYRNRSSSQLIDYPIAATAGFTSIRNNLDAVVQNSGIEAEISGSILKGNLRWDAAFNLTLPRNKLVSFPGLANSSYASQYIIGKPLSISRVYELKGVDPQTGVYVFRDFDGDGAVTSANDRGKAIEKGIDAYGGLTNSFAYRNFEFSFLLQFVFQRSQSFRSLLTVAPGRTNNQPAADQGRYWDAPGEIAELQRPTTGNNAAAQAAFTLYPSSDAAIADASFARLKNLSLSYRSTKIIPNRALRLYLQGQNVYTMTNYFGLDPESPSLITPPLRTVTLGLQLIL